MKEKWYLQTKKADFYKISKKFNITPMTARLIRNRDIENDAAIEEYLYPNIDRLSSPWLFKDMDTAVNILKIKISQNNKIRIICDYDVDGICSGYILYRSLKELEANVDVVVPHRIEDGYGINERLIKNAFDDGVDTILTCDNGIAAYDPIAFAKSLGMTVIVTDHHEVPFDDKNGEKIYIIPPADAVIDAKQPDCEYPFKNLCGAMAAYQLIAALYDSSGKSVRETYKLIPYAAMATICDIVELKGENRTIVKLGIKQMRNISDVGINALMEACNIDKRNIEAYHFGFVLGPCLNASGRLDTAQKAMKLLDSKDRETAKRLSLELRRLNDERKEMTEKGTEEAIRIAAEYEDSVLVVYLPNCHESIAGIIAGRVREKYNKPAFILTDAEGGAKGSGRSIEEYDMYTELTKVKDLFTKFGGHKMAAGISLEKENIDEFRKRLNANCTLTKEDLYLKVWIDMQLPFEYVTINFINELQLISPWGKGNEKPLFAEKNIKILKMRILGKSGNVLGLDVENSAHYRMRAVIFSKTQEFMHFIMEKFGVEEVNKAMEGKRNNIEIMAAYFPKINEFNGNMQIQIVIERFC